MRYTAKEYAAAKERAWNEYFAFVNEERLIHGRLVTTWDFLTPQQRCELIAKAHVRNVYDSASNPTDHQTFRL